jgi:hypothetical protein
VRIFFLGEIFVNLVVMQLPLAVAVSTLRLCCVLTSALTSSNPVADIFGDGPWAIEVPFTGECSANGENPIFKCNRIWYHHLHYH